MSLHVILFRDNLRNAVDFFRPSVRRAKRERQRELQRAAEQAKIQLREAEQKRRAETKEKLRVILARYQCDTREIEEILKQSPENVGIFAEFIASGPDVSRLNALYKVAIDGIDISDAIPAVENIDQPNNWCISGYSTARVLSAHYLNKGVYGRVVKLLESTRYIHSDLPRMGVLEALRDFIMRDKLDLDFFVPVLFDASNTTTDYYRVGVEAEKLLILIDERTKSAVSPEMKAALEARRRSRESYARALADFEDDDTSYLSG